MKLRLRSMEARGGAVETHRVEVPPTATLADVRALLAAKLSAAQPVPAESVRFSLNRAEELVSPDPAARLPDLGLASGDLVYFTLSPLWVPAAPAQAAAPNPSHPGRASITKPAEQVGGASGGTSSPKEVNPSLPVVASGHAEDVVMVEAVDTTNVWSSFVLKDLKREMENVAGAEGTVVGRLIAALHAALLDVGFRTSNPVGSRLTLPQGWPSGASEPLIINYTLPEFLSMSPVPGDGKLAVLNFSMMGNFIMVYGYLPSAQCEMRRLCLELPKLEPLLYLDSDQLGRVQEGEVLGLWRVLKDEMCLPLMISLCQVNSMPLPPCLMALPADLKTKILDFLPGLDLGRVQCTCKEMKTLASDDDLWKKFVHGEGSREGKSAKARFAEAYANSKRRPKRPSQIFRDYGWGNPPFVPHRFPVIGGDQDRLPFVGNIGSLGRGFGNQRRNVMPDCHLCGGGRNFF